jgi:hypothetical protein
VTHDRGAWRCQVHSIFVGDIEPMNIHAYIRRFHVTDEYIIIFLGTKKYNILYTSVLHSSTISLINRGIYSKFIGFIGKFLGCNQRMHHSFL